MSDLPAAARQASRSLLKELKGVRSIEDQTEKNISPVTIYVRSLAALDNETYYTASEVAEQLGCSVQAVRKYAKNQVCGEGVAPSKYARLGKLVVNLYTPDDVQALRDFLANRQVVFKTRDRGRTPEPTALREAREANG